MVHSKTFNLKDGKNFSSIKAFAKELREMSSVVYNHHVSPVKNDFSNWVKNSMKEDILSKKVDGHINKIEMELEILRHLIHSNSKIKTLNKKKFVKNNSKIINKIKK